MQLLAKNKKRIVVTMGSALVVALVYAGVYAAAPGKVAVVKTPNLTVVSSTSPPIPATPEATPKPKVLAATYAATPVPTPNNTALCNQLIATERSILLPLQAQWKDQLALLQRMASNSGNITKYGGYSAAEQISSSTNATARFNAVVRVSDDLQAQFSSARTDYQGLLSANGCYAQIRAQTWPIQ